MNLATLLNYKLIDLLIKNLPLKYLFLSYNTNIYHLVNPILLSKFSYKKIMYIKQISLDFLSSNKI